MPEVSTRTRSNPATLQAAITSGRLFEISLSAPRVASERMNTRAPAIAFMRMRSPSSAPPDFLREGSTARMAMRSEEHTSELQSPYDLVCRLLLEKKKNK